MDKVEKKLKKEFLDVLKMRGSVAERLSSAIGVSIYTIEGWARSETMKHKFNIPIYEGALRHVFGLNNNEPLFDIIEPKITEKEY